MANNLPNFWNELKRRRVVRIIPVYAAAAYVLLELVDIISAPFGLPDWTLKLVFVLLAIGLVIAVILSWIYDVTPEGIKKTRSIHKRPEQPKETPAKIMSWKIATYLSIAIIIGLLIVNIVGNKKQAINLSGLQKSIAVLPFENWNSDEEFQHLGDAIANEITTQLSLISKFHVISYTSSSRYKGSDKPPMPQIGKELGANFIIEGTVERQAEDVSIHVQVIQAQNDDHLWAQPFKGKWKDIFAIRANIAKKVAEELKTVLSPDETKQIEKEPTKNHNAYNLYLRGNFFVQQHSEENLNKAIECFENAIKLDSTYALAYVGLAQCYQFMVRYSMLPRNEGYSVAKEAILKAIDLDTTLGEAHATLGLMMMVFDLDIYGPEEEFQEAIKLSPNSVDVYTSYAQYLRWMARYDEGIIISKKAIELDPMTAYTNLWLGYMYFYTGRYDESIAHLKRIISLDSNYPYTYAHLAFNYTLKGSRTEAIYYADKTMSIGNTGADPMLSCCLAWVYAKSGEITKAKQILTHWQTLENDINVDPAYIALIYDGLGENEKAFEWLLKAWEERSGHIIYLKAHSTAFLKDIASDPRYIDLLKKIGFKVD
jgi:TolB-like protein/Tfp pilus assembly protein PilF